jgi:hypothetical protein
MVMTMALAVATRRDVMARPGVEIVLVIAVWGGVAVEEALTHAGFQKTDPRC